MRVIKPLDITDAKLTSSSIPEPDASVGEVEWTAGTYTLGTQRIVLSTHKVYQVVADPSTADDPVTGSAKAVPTWVEVAPTNKWAMFDTVVGTQSTGSTPLTVELTPSEITNSIAGFNITGTSSVNVTVNSVAEGEVYNRTIDMLDNSSVFDFYTWCFNPIIQTTEFVILDMPAYSDQTISVAFSGDLGIAVGALAVGNQTILGTALYGSRWQALDFSRKERDEFGNFTIVPRATADRFEYDVAINKNLFGYFKNTIKSLTGIPCVWVGTDDTGDGTMVFGYYVDTGINLSSPSILDATITVEGLV